MRFGSHLDNGAKAMHGTFLAYLTEAHSVQIVSQNKCNYILEVITRADDVEYI